MNKMMKILCGFMAFWTLGSSCYSQNSTYQDLEFDFDLEKMVLGIEDGDVVVSSRFADTNWPQHTPEAPPLFAVSTDQQHFPDQESGKASSVGVSSATESPPPYEGRMHPDLSSFPLAGGREATAWTEGPPPYGYPIQTTVGPSHLTWERANTEFLAPGRRVTPSPQFGWSPFAYLATTDHDRSPSYEAPPAYLTTTDRDRLPSYEAPPAYLTITQRRMPRTSWILPSYEEAQRPQPCTQSIF